MKKILSWALCAVIVSSFVVWSAQVAVVSTDTRQEAWAKETLNNSDLQTNIDTKEGTLTNSAGLAAALSDETGTGVAVFGTSPTLITPALGTPSALVGTNISAMPYTGLADGTDGNLITWAADASIAVVATGTAGHVLTSGGAGVAPTFQSAGGATAWDDIGDPDAASSIDFGVHVSELYVDDFRIGKDGTDYIKFTDTGITLHGAYTFTGTWTFTDSDVTPTAGQLVYDNTVTGITNGALSWHDFTEVRFILDYTALPTADGEFPIYDQDLDEFVNLPMSGDITMTEAGVTAIGADKVAYQETTGSFKSLTPVNDSAANFAANFTGANLYGGTFLCSTTGTIQLPAVTAGMNFTIITVGAIAVHADTNASDLMMLDGVSLDDGDKATNASTAGDIIVFQYMGATGWVATSNGWTDGGA